MSSDLQRALAMGRDAGKREEPTNVCPYSEGITRNAWMRGWREGMETRSSK